MPEHIVRRLRQWLYQCLKGWKGGNNGRKKKRIYFLG